MIHKAVPVSWVESYSLNASAQGALWQSWPVGSARGATVFVNVSYTHLVVVVTYLALTVWALASIWRHDGAGTGQKVVWTVAVLVVPYVGALAWAAVVAVSSWRRSTSGA